MAYPPPHDHHHHPPPPPNNNVHGNIVKIFCKLDKTFSLAVRNDKPVMLPSNSEDPTQVITPFLCPSDSWCFLFYRVFFLHNDWSWAWWWWLWWRYGSKMCRMASGPKITMDLLRLLSSTMPPGRSWSMGRSKAMRFAAMEEKELKHKNKNELN